MDKLLRTFASWNKIEYSLAINMFTKLSLIKNIEYNFIKFLENVIVMRNTEIRVLRNKIIQLENPDE